MQLGLSRKNKRIEFRASNGQLHLSKVIPDKNLAASLANIASDSTRVLAKLRVLTEEARIIALTTVRGQGLASVCFGSSLDGGAIPETPAMASHQLRQLDLSKSDYESFRSCFERQCLTLPSLSFDKPSLQSTSLQSLNLPSLSFQKSDQDSFATPGFARKSLTEHSLSLDNDTLQSNSLESLTETSLSLIESHSASLILHSCSLRTDNESSLTLQSLSFTSDSLEEIEKKKAHIFALGELRRTASPSLAHPRIFQQRSL